MTQSPDWRPDGWCRLGDVVGGGARERGRSGLLLEWGRVRVWAWGQGLRRKLWWGVWGVSDPESLWRKSCGHLQAQCLKFEIMIIIKFTISECELSGLCYTHRAL